ncbi:MAG: hypothetical protein ACYTBV_05295, partial [Planctomycetota bacterium]
MESRFKLGYRSLFVVLFFVFVVFPDGAEAVSSDVTRHNSSADFHKGKSEDVLISSQGVIQLGRAAEILVKEFENVWSVNSLIVNRGVVYVGTSPNGNIYKYSMGELTKIYPEETDEDEDSDKIVSDLDQAAEANDANVVKAEEHLTNEHIFAMATDASDRLLAGISGEKSRLLRYEAGGMETVFEPNDAKYIFSIVAGAIGEIYLGTGPEGKIYRFDSSADEGELFYDSQDKNILSLTVGKDGFVYAGSDSRGLIYKIDPQTKQAEVLYDSDQPEVIALMFGEDGELYAATTSAEVVKTQNKFASQLPLAGKPESPTGGKPVNAKSDSDRKLKVAHTKQKKTGTKSGPPPMPSMKGKKPAKASYVYKVTKEGYVTDIFSENAVLFCLAVQQGKMLVGTGNNGQLYTVDHAHEDQAIIYEDKQASQITAVSVWGEDLYVGTANPPRLIKLGSRITGSGTYTSDLIDASQPARWGKLQVEADIPEQCRLLVASRSGNVKDVNDPTFSKWSREIEISEPVQLQNPLGRFCQYKLVLESTDGKSTPLIREVAVAHSVPNLAPKVEAVAVDRYPMPEKQGMFKVGYKAKDDNKDKLIYTISFRKIGRTKWIEIEDEAETPSFDWNGRTVEDGRYEIRIVASDERDNTSETKLTGSRISDPVVVDNSPPFIKKDQVKKTRTKDGKADVTILLTTRDDLSAIGKVYYTVDSNSKWKGLVPDDLVYDT